MANELYKKESRHKIPVEVAIADLGYSPTSGSGLRVLAALLNFGLLSEEGASEGRKVGLSDLGKSIVMDTRPLSSDRDRAVQEAALNPNIHRELWERWQLEDAAMPSDQTMRFSLLRDYDFNETAVNSFIKEFKETLAYAQLGKEFRTEQEEPRVQPEPPDQGQSDAQRAASPLEDLPKINPQLRELTFPLIGGDVLTLIVPHPLTKRDFRKLQQWISLMEDALLYRDLSNFDEESAEDE